MRADVRLMRNRKCSNSRGRSNAFQLFQVQSVVATEVLLIFKFVVTNSIPLFLDCWEAATFKGAEESQMALFKDVAYVSNFIVCLNSATNCTAYLGCGKAFFKLLSKAFRRVSSGKSMFR